MGKFYIDETNTSPEEMSRMITRYNDRVRRQHREARRRLFFRGISIGTLMGVLLTGAAYLAATKISLF